MSLRQNAGGVNIVVRTVGDVAVGAGTVACTVVETTPTATTAAAEELSPPSPPTTGIVILDGLGSGKLTEDKKQRGFFFVCLFL